MEAATAFNVTLGESRGRKSEEDILHPSVGHLVS